MFDIYCHVCAMKNIFQLTSLLLVLGLFTACEKFELDDHCPEDGQQEAQFNPQDMRVNDDSDDEEASTTIVNKSTDADGQGAFNKNSVSSTSNTSDNATRGGDDDEFINDDSDDEDEGPKPRSSANSSTTSGGGSGRTIN